MVTSSVSVLLNISHHHKEFYLASIATEFVPIYKLRPESPSDAISLIVSAVYRMPVTRQNASWHVPPTRQRFALRKLDKTIASAPSASCRSLL